jgi:hypothetical protein
MHSMKEFHFTNPTMEADANVPLPVEPSLCLRPVPLLPEPGHVEIGRLVQIIFCRPFLDFIEKPGFVVGAIVAAVVVR